MRARRIMLGCLLALGLLLVGWAFGWVPVGPSGPERTTEGIPILVAGPPPAGMLTTVGCVPEGVAGEVVRDPSIGLTIEGYTIVWPHGYTARAEGAAAVLVKDDRVVARTGDVVRVMGGAPNEAGVFTVCGDPVVEP